MSTYEKPMVKLNEELAEGVYAASGDKWQYKSSTTMGGALPEGSTGLDIIVKNTWEEDNSEWEEYTVRIPLTGEAADVVVVGGAPGSSATVDGNYLIITSGSLANPRQENNIQVAITPKNPGETIGIIEE